MFVILTESLKNLIKHKTNSKQIAIAKTNQTQWQGKFFLTHPRKHHSKKTWTVLNSIVNKTVTIKQVTKTMATIKPVYRVEPLSIEAMKYAQIECKTN